MAERPSQRQANVGYYRRNRAREIERVRGRQTSTVAFLRSLRTVPCADCGRVYEPHQMDFDHLDPSLKRFRLTSGAVSLKSHQALLGEAQRCEVVCANCHRIRTWIRHADRSETLPASPQLERRRALWRSQAKVLDSLRDVPCADCQRRFPACAMDFDHRDPSTKRQAVTRMIGRSGTRRILAEVAKCDIVCANCHRLRTYVQRMAVPSVRE